MADSHTFIFAVFLMYGFIFAMFTLSDGAIVGLPSASVYEPSSDNVDTASFTDWLVGGIETIVTFFLILLVPVTDLWYIVPINWAIIGTTIYLLIRVIRGGG